MNQQLQLVQRFKAAGCIAHLTRIKLRCFDHGSKLSFDPFPQNNQGLRQSDRITLL